MSVNVNDIKYWPKQQPSIKQVNNESQAGTLALSWNHLQIILFVLFQLSRTTIQINKLEGTNGIVHPSTRALPL